MCVLRKGIFAYFATFIACLVYVYANFVNVRSNIVIDHVINIFK